MKKKWDISNEIEYQICRNIFNIRKNKKMTQQDIADRAGISNDYVSLLERNKRHLSIQILTKITKALEVDISEILKYNKKNEINKNEVNNKYPKIRSITELLQNLEILEINTIHDITQKLYNLAHPRLPNKKKN
ncbi:helix-turn-helix transcriptional regulator [Candidatus Poribacteria bacterium]|nr:helix-turn-helix transcriptional regulator [Candidatus Poribacteria bacterium]